MSEFIMPIDPSYEEAILTRRKISIINSERMTRTLDIIIDVATCDLTLSQVLAKVHSYQAIYISGYTKTSSGCTARTYRATDGVRAND